MNKTKYTRRDLLRTIGLSTAVTALPTKLLAARGRATGKVRDSSMVASEYSISIDPQRWSIGNGDIWPITWMDDDEQFSFFVDGRGFSNDRKDWASMGPAVLSGMPPDLMGKNVKSPTGTAHGPGAKGRKVSGLVMIDYVLYALVRNAGDYPGGKGGATGSCLMWSSDRGLTWTWERWSWPEIGYPVWLNCGRNYVSTRDSYAYFVSPNTANAYHDSPDIILARVPMSEIRIKDKYEFFAGLNGSGKPKWSSWENRAAILSDSAGCFRPDFIYNPGLDRYFLLMISPKNDWKFWRGKNPLRKAHFGFFESPNPWGPWSVVAYIENWGAPECRYQPKIFPKGMSADGLTFYLAYSCILVGPYQLNYHQCTMRHRPTRRSG